MECKEVGVVWGVCTKEVYFAMGECGVLMGCGKWSVGLWCALGVAACAGSSISATVSSVYRVSSRLRASGLWRHYVIYGV